MLSMEGSEEQAASTGGVHRQDSQRQSRDRYQQASCFTNEHLIVCVFVCDYECVFVRERECVRVCACACSLAVCMGVSVCVWD